MILLLDNGHGANTPGKCSPDKRLKEYEWARDMVRLIAQKAKAKGIQVEFITPETYDVPLAIRKDRVNDLCRKYGTKNCILVSVHNNAAGADGKWHDARGFSVFVSKNASTNSKRCAAIFTEEAQARNLLGNRSVPAEKYWTWSWTKSDIYILKNTNCPAVLTECLFQDNKTDVDYLLSETGMQELADLHITAIERYIKTMPK
ncbi:MAG: N-acetylmuramoyl-L-alanine amidase [Prevotella sp.]|nr:N-acetylmuramoyl-L-alanine amidase [Lachnospiraceae bacterium]MCM1379584.1 N-acetylmuramoyl-L-alanine amidase [Bacteroides sp.]MCM1445815.1 N-acetylmuramoyl-L-alanine amidase [Prevotella sp.]